MEIARGPMSVNSCGQFAHGGEGSSSCVPEVHKFPDARISEVFDLFASDEMFEPSVSGKAKIRTIEVCQTSQQVLESRYLVEELSIHDRPLSMEAHPVEVVTALALVNESVADRLAALIVDVFVLDRESNFRCGVSYDRVALGE